MHTQEYCTGCISRLTKEHFYIERWCDTFNNINSSRLTSTVELVMHESMVQVAYEDQTIEDVFGEEI